MWVYEGWKSPPYAAQQDVIIIWKNWFHERHSSPFPQMCLSWLSWTWVVIVYWAYARLTFYIHKFLEQGVPSLDFMEQPLAPPREGQVLHITRGPLLQPRLNLAFGLFPIEKCYIFNIDLYSFYPEWINEMEVFCQSQTFIIHLKIYNNIVIPHTLILTSGVIWEIRQNALLPPTPKSVSPKEKRTMDFL